MSGERPPDDTPFHPELVVELTYDGELDLHTFHPRDMREVTREYLLACRTRGVLSVRVVHGKGTGAQRQAIHALLARMPEVASYETADPSSGGWGATWVRLLPPDEG